MRRRKKEKARKKCLISERLEGAKKENRTGLAGDVHMKQEKEGGIGRKVPA